MNFEAYPAIDVRNGRVVRLRQGDYAKETRYPRDPLAQAIAFAREGARWLHLVDLDAARTGGYSLGALLAAIKGATSLRVQTGGGIRDDAGIAALLAAGADRVVVGSLAVREPERVGAWLARFGAERIVVALDIRTSVDGHREVPTQGWTAASGVEPLARLALHGRQGLRHALCTDIGRDGMLSGIDPTLYRALATAAPGVAVQCSGGIRTAADVREARAAGCAGAILGRALLEGHTALAPVLEAVAC